MGIGNIILKLDILLLFRLLSMLWLAILGLSFFPVKVVMVLTGILVIGLFTFFYRQIEVSYRWFERQFLSTFEDADGGASPSQVLNDFAPWDAHLVSLKVHPRAPIRMKRLLDSKLRSQFGVNVVAIQRGESVIVAPKPDELILPHDQLLILGTDEQLEKVRPILEPPAGAEELPPQFEDYELRQYRIPRKSSLVGKLIRSSGISEKTRCLIVGLEHGSERLMNPGPDRRLSPSDVIWIVGRKKSLDNLYQEFFAG